MIKPYLKFLVFAICGILVLFGSFVTADFVNYFYRANVSMIYPYIPKLLVSFIVALIAWTSGSVALNNNDSLHLKIYFSLVFLGDICLFIVSVTSNVRTTGRFFIFGFILFMLAHLANLVRLYPWVKVPGKIKAQGFPWWSLPAVIIPASLIIALLAEPLSRQGLLVPALVYNYLIAGTILFSLLARLNGVMPSGNTYLAIFASIGFYVCDILGAVYNSFPGTELALFVVALIWIAYTPGILLNALSGISWKKLV